MRRRIVSREQRWRAAIQFYALVANSDEGGFQDLNGPAQDAWALESDKVLRAAGLHIQEAAT